MKKFNKRGLLVATMMATGLLVGANAEAARISVSCPKHVQTCYYTFMSGSSMRNFTLPGGVTDDVLAFPGDLYCVSYTGVNNPRTCGLRPIPM